MRLRITVFLLLAAAVLSASEFQDRQAARAVIGQPSFSAREKGLVARSLSISKGNLYVADASGRVLTYDLSRIGSVKTAACPVCIVPPQSTVAQNVFEGAGTAAAYGRNIAVADAKAHRVMIWRGVSGTQKPDLILSGFMNPVSVALDNQRLFVGDAGSHHVYIWNSIPSSETQPADVVLGVAESSDGPGADTVQTPVALASDGVNLYVADSASRRVLIFSTAEVAAPEVSHAATLLAEPLAPGTLVTLNHVSGVKPVVLLNGRSVRVTEFNKDRLQVQVPIDLNNATAGSLFIRSEREDGSVRTTFPAALRFVPASPGIFAFGPKEPRTGLLLHAPAGVPLSPEDPAKSGETLTIWATGLGAVAPDRNEEGSFDVLTPVRASMNGNAVDVISAALPADATGVYEVRLRLPLRLPKTASLMLIQNDVRSNIVTFPTQTTRQ